VTDSRNKGARGELELHKLLAELIEDKHIQRTGLQQAGGGGFDLIIPYLGIEVKRRAKPITYADVQVFWKQTQAQADTIEMIGVLAFRADRQPWQFVIPQLVAQPKFEEDDETGDREVHMRWSFVTDLETSTTMYLEGFKQWYCYALPALQATQPEKLDA